MTTDKIKSVIDYVSKDTQIPETQRDTIVQRLESIPSPLATDPWIYRMVVLFLGIAVLSTVIGGILLAYIGGTSNNYQIPQGIIAIGSAAIGALAGLLAPSPKQQN